MGIEVGARHSSNQGRAKAQVAAAATRRRRLAAVAADPKKAVAAIRWSAKTFQYDDAVAALREFRTVMGVSAAKAVAEDLRQQHPHAPVLKYALREF